MGLGYLKYDHETQMKISDWLIEDGGHRGWDMLLVSIMLLQKLLRG